MIKHSNDLNSRTTNYLNTCINEHPKGTISIKFYPKKTTYHVCIKSNKICSVRSRTEALNVSTALKQVWRIAKRRTKECRLCTLPDVVFLVVSFADQS
jgi:hypothetical protein